MAFNPNYEYKSFSEETYNYKEHYDTNLYVIFDKEVFIIGKNSVYPLFSCYIKVKSDKYGDPAGAILDDGDGIVLRVVDNAGGTVVSVNMSQVDDNLGEWRYQFSPFDFTLRGSYEAQILFKNSKSSNAESLIGKCKVNVED